MMTLPVLAGQLLRVGCCFWGAGLVSGLREDGGLRSLIILGYTRRGLGLDGWWKLMWIDILVVIICQVAVLRNKLIV